LEYLFKFQDKFDVDDRFLKKLSKIFYSHGSGGFPTVYDLMEVIKGFKWKEVNEIKVRRKTKRLAGPFMKNIENERKFYQ
jgi:hypothetical protein